MLLLAAATRFVASNPVPGIGIVVKKNRPPGSSARVAATNANGEFTIPLEVGSYTITLPATDVRAAVARIASQTAAARRAAPGRLVDLRDDAVSLTLRETSGLRLAPCLAMGYADVALVTVSAAGAALTGQLTWDDAAPVVDGAASGAPRILVRRDGTTIDLRSPVTSPGNTRPTAGEARRPTAPEPATRPSSRRAEAEAGDPCGTTR